VRRKLRIAFWAILLAVPLALMAADRLSRRQGKSKRGIRLVTVNVDTRPSEVAEALRSLDPDVIFMQEAAVSCVAAARALGLHVHDGSDQCLLSRWPLSRIPVAWPGPWQPPQLLTAAHPEAGPVTLVNLRFAIPEVVAALATLGHQWYSEQQRRAQYPALRDLIHDRSPVIMCGDFNALPWEVDLGSRFRDMWVGFRYGATFPSQLPAARIDQCWTAGPVAVEQTWTQLVPSDHRAVVADVRVGDAALRSSNRP
jgi:endonuclease/exonuclease/phosphatase (EEP) superfamily protein YafD